VLLWECQKFDPHRIETPDHIGIKFGLVDYVVEKTALCHISCKAVHLGFSQRMGEIYVKIYLCIGEDFDAESVSAEVRQPSGSEALGRDATT